MRDLIGLHLQRIEWHKDGFVARLYPFTRSRRSPAEEASQPRVVTMDPRVEFGRPMKNTRASGGFRRLELAAHRFFDVERVLAIVTAITAVGIADTFRMGFRSWSEAGVRRAVNPGAFVRLVAVSRQE